MILAEHNFYRMFSIFSIKYVLFDAIRYSILSNLSMEYQKSEHVIQIANILNLSNFWSHLSNGYYNFRSCAILRA